VSVTAAPPGLARAAAGAGGSSGVTERPDANVQSVIATANIFVTEMAGCVFAGPGHVAKQPVRFNVGPGAAANADAAVLHSYDQDLDAAYE
jgi:hypothetical protein